MLDRTPVSWYIGRCTKGDGMAKSKKEVEQLVERLIESTSRVPDTVEFASSIVESFGGPTALAREIHATYQAAKNSPMIRGRILNDVMLLIRHASEKSTASQGAALKNLPKEDLIALVRKIMETKSASEEAPEGQA